MLTQAAFARGGAGIEAIALREIETGPPSAGEVLVRLRAATLNYRDLYFARGAFPGATKEPEYIPLSCAVGEVAQVGADVQQFAVGDRVSPLFFQRLAAGAAMSGEMLGGSVDGVARGAGVFPASSLVRVPDELSDLEAATLPCAGLTAWASLFGARPLKPGEWVLVQGTGGVALAALQWAKAAGAQVAITSSSDAKLRRARALGADVTVNYRARPDWAAAVRQALGGKGVDIVVDSAGANQLDAEVSLVNEGGAIAAVGLMDGGSNRGRQARAPIVPIAVGSREQHEAMLAFAVHHAIRPVVDVVYDLARIQDAMRLHASGAFFGKVGLNLLA